MTKRKSQKKNRPNRWEFYFAFGSNLNVEQMRRRCPTSIVVSTGILHGWRISFAGSSSLWEGYGVATVEASDGASVPGVLYLVSDRDLAKLDRWEGHPHAYRRQPVDVDIGDVVIRVWTYIKKGARLTRPCDDYLRAIAEGYAMIDASKEHWDRLLLAADAPPPPPPEPKRPPPSTPRRWAYRDGARYAFDDVPSASGGLRDMVRAAYEEEAAPVIEAGDSTGISVYAYPGGRFMADRFFDDVREALVEEGLEGDADAFCMDVMIAEPASEDEWIDLASRYVDVDTWGDDGDVPLWWFDGDAGRER